MLFLEIISWKGASRFNGEEVFFIWAGFIFKWGVHPTGRDIGFDVGGWRGGGGGFEKNCRMGSAPQCPPPHPSSEELKKCSPSSAAVQRFVNVVRERKPR